MKCVNHSYMYLYYTYIYIYTYIKILNVHWSQKVTNEVLYGDIYILYIFSIEKISTMIRRRFFKFAYVELFQI